MKRVALDDPASRYENRASAAAVASGRVYVGTHDGRVLAVDARRGTIVWQFKAADAIVATPVVAGGRVYCGSFDGHVYALDAASGSLVWKHDTGGAVTSAVAVSGRSVLAGSRSYDFAALDAASGRVVWTKYFWFSWVESDATVAGAAAYIGSSDAGTIGIAESATSSSIHPCGRERMYSRRSIGRLAAHAEKARAATAIAERRRTTGRLSAAS